MSVDENARHGLHNAIADEIGDEHAATLMSLLPPVGWADVATKTDLGHLQTDLRGLERNMEIRFEAVNRRLDQLDRLHERLDAFHRELRFMVFAAVSLAVGAASLMAAIIS